MARKACKYHEDLRKSNNWLSLVGVKNDILITSEDINYKHYKIGAIHYFEWI